MKWKYHVAKLKFCVVELILVKLAQSTSKASKLKVQDVYSESSDDEDELCSLKVK